MKCKLRKIGIDNAEYLYCFKDKYHPGINKRTLTLRVFLKDQKQTSIIIEFLTPDYYFIGQPLQSGISLNNTIISLAEKANLNEPKYIRQLILLGQKKDGPERMP
nr:hypothetical protein [uncultured Chryseobacterium sp.]